MTKLVAKVESSIADWDIGDEETRVAVLLDFASMAVLVTSRKRESGWKNYIESIKDFDEKLELECFFQQIARIESRTEIAEDVNLDFASHPLRYELDRRSFRESYRNRKQNPYLEGESQEDALIRIFGKLFKHCRGIKIVDRYVGKNLNFDRSGIHKILKALAAGSPTYVEIQTLNPEILPGDRPISMAPTREMANRYVSSFNALNTEFRIEFHGNDRSDIAKFPHPRLWQIEFDYGSIFLELDNGCDVFTERKPSSITTLSVDDLSTWSEAMQLLAATSQTAVII